MNTNLSKSEDNSERYTVPALERGLMLLSEFNRARPTLSAPELARRLDIPRSTVFRLLNTLESMGFITRTESGNEYRLGVGVLRLGFEYLASLELTDLGRPVLEKLCQDVQMPCNLVIRDENAIVYIAKASPPTPFATSVNIGTRLPAHGTVLGHVLLSELNLSQLHEQYPENKLQIFTKHTPHDVQALHDCCQAARKQGYAVSEGFFDPAISTIAVPVFGHNNKIVAAMGANAMAANFDRSKIGRIISRIQEAAEDLSSLLRHSPLGINQSTPQKSGNNAADEHA